ncbi:hypothetical protein PUNSTDRAFT_131926 [Punctularia strigosozonata HHB-11173 SS5]|uniref:uncharacterized protein n=1 Tax=Punctularia strigosozonata (strain HHB-11173) TaxID=741275 RepID=UPI0004418304|nr:uncharacterized protein PUNSTDRAFT_131926 [Punctularia strigosozonata HHB-11173 SS5]EIN11771.1 hypothetical protein PUNSTDRAFT_131926 [Punctularia strigosozonata HHB-11173 SS5]
MTIPTNYLGGWGQQYPAHGQGQHVLWVPQAVQQTVPMFVTPNAPHPHWPTHARSSDRRRRSPAWSPPASLTHPELCYGLATDSLVVQWDVRHPPNSNIPPNDYNHLGRFPVIPQSQPTHIRLISKNFPWTIDIVHSKKIYLPSPEPVSCAYMWEKLYQALQSPLEAGEWALISEDEEKATAIKEAAAERATRDGDQHIKRIDYLRGHTMFRGLKKNEELEQRILLPGEEVCAQTWVVKFGPRPK